MNLDKCKTCRHCAERVMIEKDGKITVFDACHANEAAGKYPPCKYTRKEECNYQLKKD